MDPWYKYHSELDHQFITLSGIAGLIRHADPPPLEPDLILKITRHSGSLITRAEKLMLETCLVRNENSDEVIKIMLSKVMRCIVLSSNIHGTLEERLSRKDEQEFLLFLPHTYHEILIDTYYQIGRNVLTLLPPNSFPRSEYDLHVGPFLQKPKKLSPNSPRRLP
jgi:hypothetical protein